MRSIVIFLIGALFGAFCLAAGYQFDVAGLRNWVTSLSESTEAPAPPPVRSSFTALGTIEPEHGVIHVGSPLVGHQIERVTSTLTTNGGRVNEGDLLVTIDGASIKTELKVVEAQLAEARQQRSMSIDLADGEIDSAQLALEQIAEREDVERAALATQTEALEAKLAVARKDLNRLLALRKQSESLASEQDIERGRTSRESRGGRTT